ncbi:MAG: TolC family protein [Vicinamibacterales bacterium]
MTSRPLVPLLTTTVMLTMVWTTGASAQETPSLPITLDQAISQAVANSRRIAELQARGQAADYAVAGRRAAGRPLVAAQGSYLRTNHVDEFVIAVPGGRPQVVYPDIPDNVRARLDLQWPIYTGGRTDALERAARAERTAIGKDLEAAQADLRLEVTRAFWAVVTARDTEALVRRSLEVVNVHVTDVRARLASGLIPPNDVSSAAAQASHQRLLALEASTQRAIAETDLRRLTGDDRITADGGSDAHRPAASSGAADMVAAAITARPERQALAQRAAAANARAAAAGASARPQVSVGAGYDYARPNPRIFPRRGDWQTSWDGSVNVTWTLWDGGRRAAEQGEARAGAAALESRVGDFDRQVAFEVRSRALELDASREAVSAAEDGARAATEAERVVTERYRAGVVNGTDVLDAQVARLQAELDRARAVAGVRLAEARLERAIGR